MAPSGIFKRDTGPKIPAAAPLEEMAKAEVVVVEGGRERADGAVSGEEIAGVIGGKRAQGDAAKEEPFQEDPDALAEADQRRRPTAFEPFQETMGVHGGTVARGGRRPESRGLWDWCSTGSERSMDIWALARPKSVRRTGKRRVTG